MTVPTRLFSTSTLRTGLLACACMLIALPAISGELYQWKDANGTTHYSDSPPPGKQYKSRAYRESGTASIATSDSAEPETAAGDVSKECTTAQANLKLLESGAPVGLDADKDGKPDQPFSTEQRAAQKTFAEAAIQVHCRSEQTGSTASNAN